MKTQTIQINTYPATFSFNIRTALSKFNGRKGYCEVRQKLLLKSLHKLNIYSFSHLYTDYIVEIVTKTPTGEIWTLGS